MPDPINPLRYDLSKYRLQDFEHQAGCPAAPERQEAEIVQTMVKGPQGESVPGPKAVKARCCSCGRQKLYELSDEAALKALEISSEQEVHDDGE